MKQPTPRILSVAKRTSELYGDKKNLAVAINNCLHVLGLDNEEKDTDEESDTGRPWLF